MLESLADRLAIEQRTSADALTQARPATLFTSDDVLTEISRFFEAHAGCGTWPGGVHVELTGDAVTECVGGADDISHEDLEQAFETLCDPRLNGRQSVDLAFRVAEMLAERR